MSDAMQFRRELQIGGVFDVIVAGGGPAGCAAATAAARLGAKVLLIEATGMLGGMGTAGLVPAWCPFSDKEKIIYRGIAEEVFRASATPVTLPDPARLDWVPIDAEALKRVYDDLAERAGVEVRLGVQLAAVEMRDSRHVDAVITSGKDGLLAWRAAVFIDATGDGDLAAWAGAECEQADECQPATHCFHLGNVDTAAYLQGKSLHSNNPESPIYGILKSGKFPLISDAHACQCLVAETTVGFNAGHLWKIDSTASADVSAGLRQGRRMAADYLRALREFVPEAFGNACLAQTAPLLGIREGRRIAGEYRFTAEDYIARRTFEDEIGRNAYYIDVHGCRKEETGGNNPHLKFERYGRGESHGIPYRCLVPRDLDNVLASGRCISSDRAANGSLRVMPVCLVTGQAAGTAAHLLAASGVPARELDAGRLRNVLRENGAWFL